MTQPKQKVIQIKNISGKVNDGVACGSTEIIERAKDQNKSGVLDQYKKRLSSRSS